MKKFLLLISLAITAGLVSLSFTSQNETYSLKGQVIDAQTGDPMIGASVIEDGTRNGTVTDVDGKFVLKISKKCTALNVEYVGYESTKIEKACDQQELKINMQPASIHLEECVVVGKSRKLRGRAKRSRPAPAQNHIGYMQHGDVRPNWNTEDYDVINENRFLGVSQEPLSTFSIDVDAASYSNMRRFLKNSQQPPVDAVRIEEMVNYFNYDYPQPDNGYPFEVITELSECPWQPDHQLLHIGLQGKKIPNEDLPASNIVFLIDVSGSMNSSNKLPLLKSSFKLLTDQLREQDRVAMVVYAGAAGLVLESTSGDQKKKIKNALHQLSAGGSTAGGAGIQLAYKVARENFIEGGNNRVILATDGDFNVGASSDAAMVRLIEKERESGVFLTVLGFGMGNYKDNKMQQLANKGNGNHAYIDDIQEAKKVLVTEFGGTVFTIAKDVKIQIEFNPEKVQAYRLIGYENRMLENEDFNDDKKDAGELGSGHTVTALYEIIPPGVESDFIADVDELKYQKKGKTLKGNQEELATVKLRYKKPSENNSQKIVHTVNATASQLNASSDNFRWSAAVAEFGMLLRNSEFKGEATYAHAKKMARQAKGEDANGYRHELIDMMDIMNRLAEPVVVEKE